MAKSTKALLMGRIQMCKTNPSIAHIGLATHGRSIQIGSSDSAIYFWFDQFQTETLPRVRPAWAAGQCGRRGGHSWWSSVPSKA